MNYDIIENFYHEVKENLGNDYKIVVDLNSKLNASFIEKDSISWYLEDNMYQVVNDLKNSNELSLEEKILEFYKYLCLNYIYDDNVLYFFKKDQDKYIAVDWYGRIINKEWVRKREKHNRRICYEFSRVFAHAINIFIEDKDNMEAFILALKDNTHYITVISGDKYSAILDLDDFNNIKDLTRLKLGLTMKGITILRDDNNILKETIDTFNKDKKEELDEVLKLKKNLLTEDLLRYFKEVIKVIKKYNLDAQGFQEYMKVKLEEQQIVVDKIWEKIEDNPRKRYVRCLIFKYNNKQYLIDTIKQELTIYDESKLDKDIFVINPEDNFYYYYER